MSQTPWEENIDTENQDPNPDAEQQQGGDAASADLDVEKLQAERDALFTKLARAQADFKNAQKRLEQDKEQAIQFANSQLIKALIPVVDNLDRAAGVDPAKTDAAAILKGMQIVIDQFNNILANQGVEVVNPAPGTPFDPTKHEALMHQPGDQYTQPTVTMSLQKGYVMNGRTLRPAGVAVSP